MKLTPNQRMAVFLRERLQESSVLPIKVWLEQLYSTLTLEDPLAWPLGLKIHEEELIWEKALLQSSSEIPQSKVLGFARMAKEAWKLSIEWRVPLASDLYQTEDSLVFLEWAQNYQKICLENAWCDSATIVDKLIEAVSQNKLDLPSKITLVGFEELTPQYQEFFEALRKFGTAIDHQSLVQKQGKLSRISASHLEEELQLAAAMTEQWLKRTKNASIGIVVPELARDRAVVVRVLQASLPPRSFNIAAPIALQRYPLIDAALLFINLFAGEKSQKEWSHCLTSPFWLGSETEKNSRAALDVAILNFAEVEFSLESFIKKIEFCMQKKDKLRCELALQALKNLQLERLKLKSKRAAEEWSEIFSACLEIMGWPGERPLTAEEEQIKEQWEKLLSHYKEMGRILGLHEYGVALKEIKRLCSNIVFLPASYGGPVKVLGILESIGIPFDYLWVVGLYREVWPQDPSPNPFIPRVLQNKYGLPRSTAARELKMAKQFTERLCQGGKEVIFSYPKHLEEGEGFVSPLLEFIPEVTVADLNLSGFSKPEEDPKALLQFFIPNYTEKAPTVLADEKILGGTNILKSQALCPFKAFAESRLQAYPLQSSSLGLNPAERGQIIHEILAKIWVKIKNQRILFSLSTEELDKVLNTAIESIFQNWLLKIPKTLTPEYFRLEKARTYDLLIKVMDLEKTRPYFEVIAVEQKQELDFKGLKITTRIDRIDRVSDGEEVIIDYKTGKTSVSDWFGDRLQDPQLPIYSVTRDPKPSALAYLLVRPDGIKFQGISKDKEMLPGVKTSEQLEKMGAESTLEQQYEAWQKSLEQLAEDFCDGVANVDPVEGEQTCRLCSLKPLCRVGS